MTDHFKAYIHPPEKKGGMAFIEIPPEIADELLKDHNKLRVVIHFDNNVSFHRALMRNKDGMCFIVLGKTTLKEAKKAAGGVETIRLEKDKSKYGMPMPEEFEEVLRQDEEGNQLFEKLTAGLKRSFLYYINSGKTVDTRIKRSLELVERLKGGGA